MTDFIEVDLQKGTVNVEIFKKTDAALSSLRERFSIVPIVTEDNYNEVAEGLKELTKYRTSLEKKRVEIKKPYLDKGKLIDAEAKRITAVLVSLEDPIKAAKKEYDDREEIKRQERIARLQKKVDAIYDFERRAKNMASNEISELLEELYEIDTANDFYDLTDDATQARSVVLAKLSEILNDRLIFEKSEADRIKAESEVKEQTRKQNIKNTISNIINLPMGCIGKSAQEIETEISRLGKTKFLEIDFQEFYDEALAARDSAYNAMNVMLNGALQLEAMMPKPEDDPKKGGYEYDEELHDLPNILSNAENDIKTKSGENNEFSNYNEEYVPVPVKTGRIIVTCPEHMRSSVISTLMNEYCVVTSDGQSVTIE